MKKFPLVLIAALLSVLTAAGQDFSLFAKKEYTRDGVVLPYRILYPEQINDGEKVPLFVFLHGMGMRGTDNERQLSRGADLFLKPENRKDFPCIAFYPQVPETSAFVTAKENGKNLNYSRFATVTDHSTISVAFTPYGEMVYDVIQQLIQSGAVDTNRIYISGSSMGGFSTFHFIAEYPELFAAAAPMAGGATVTTVGKWAGKVPVWIVHGDADQIVGVEASRRVHEELKRLGVAHRYSEYPGAKHNSWDNAFAEPDYISWFFSHSGK